MVYEPVLKEISIVVDTSKVKQIFDREKWDFDAYLKAIEVVYGAEKLFDDLYKLTVKGTKSKYAINYVVPRSRLTRTYEHMIKYKRLSKSCYYRGACVRYYPDFPYEYPRVYSYDIKFNLLRYVVKYKNDSFLLAANTIINLTPLLFPLYSLPPNVPKKFPFADYKTTYFTEMQDGVYKTDFYEVDFDNYTIKMKNFLFNPSSLCTYISVVMHYVREVIKNCKTTFKVDPSFLKEITGSNYLHATSDLLVILPDNIRPIPAYTCDLVFKYVDNVEVPCLKTRKPICAYYDLVHSVYKRINPYYNYVLFTLLGDINKEPPINLVENLYNPGFIGFKTVPKGVLLTDLKYELVG